MGFTISKTLLAKLRDSGEESWMEFYQNYRPLIYSVCSQAKPPPPECKMACRLTAVRPEEES
ncbi:MAG: hypothetical protein PHI85_00380 [Victivallaceae bacterium]|nr:hypothetical protein [Victivallaceae bacterium]